MSRSKTRALGIGALLGAVAWTCDGATAPPEAGSILGKVMVEGEGLDGVSVSLSNGSSQVTSGGGSYRFDGVEGGTYAVSISGYPADAAFDAATGSATIASAGQSVTVDFLGSWIRTSALTGTVMAGDMRLEGVMVRLSGMSEGSTMTDAMGAYAFSGLRAGSHTVEISGFDADLYAFAETSVTRTLAVASTEVADFSGTMLRTAGIAGVVEAEGEPLAGVAVEISGVEEHRAATDSDGVYAFADLLPGSYTVSISGYDADRVSFSEESMDVEAAANAVAKADFSGTLLRGASISGHVLADGQPVQGAVVELDGPEDAASTRTDADGMYVFSGLLPGTWTVLISGYDAESYEFAATSREVTLDPGERGTVDFQGSMLRTAAIAGAVSVEGMFVAGMAVRLTGGDMDAAMNATTDASGVYSFRGLKAGTYMVAIMPSEAQMGMYAFEDMEMEVEAMDDMETRANFSGTHVRTARISGMLVLAGGEKTLHDAGAAGLSGAVKLTLNGPGVADARTAMTDEMGMYSFGELKAGSYRLVYTSPPMNPTHTKMTGGDLGATGMVIELDAGEEVEHDFEYELTHHSLSVMAKYGYANCAKDDCMSDMGVEGVMVKAVAADPGDHAKGWGQEALAEAKTDADGMAVLEIPTGSLDGSMVYLMGSLAHTSVDLTAQDATDTAMVDPMSLKSESKNPMLYLATKANVTLTVRTVRRGAAGNAYMSKAEVAAFKGTSKTASATATTGSNGSASLTVSATPSKTGKYRVGMKDSKLYFHHDMDDEDMEYLEFTHNGLHPPDKTMHLGTLVVGHKTVSVKVGAHRELDDVAGVSCVPLKATDKTCTGDRKDTAAADGDLRLHLEKKDASGSWARVSLAEKVKADSASHVFTGVQTQVEPGTYRVRAELSPWLENKDAMLLGDGIMELDPNSVAHTSMLVACKTHPLDKKMCSSFGYKRAGHSLSAMFRSSGDTLNADGMDVELTATSLYDDEATEEDTDAAGMALIDELMDGTYEVMARTGDSDYTFRRVLTNAAMTTLTGVEYSDTLSLGKVTLGMGEGAVAKELKPEGMTHYETRFMDVALKGRAATVEVNICSSTEAYSEEGITFAKEGVFVETSCPPAGDNFSHLTEAGKTVPHAGHLVILSTRITGKIKTGTGNEMKDTTVEMSVGWGLPRWTETDEQGRFEFEGLPSEVYKITIAGAHSGPQYAYPTDYTDLDVRISEPDSLCRKRDDGNPCKGNQVWGDFTDALVIDYYNGEIGEARDPSATGAPAWQPGGYQALGFGILKPTKIKGNIWEFTSNEQSADSSKSTATITLEMSKCRRVFRDPLYSPEHSAGDARPCRAATTLSEANLADWTTNTLPTEEDVYVTMTNQPLSDDTQYWFRPEFSGSSYVLELYPGGYLIYDKGIEIEGSTDSIPQMRTDGKRVILTPFAEQFDIRWYRAGK